MRFPGCWLSDKVLTLSATVTLALLIAPSALAQVTFERLLQAEKEPENWLTYHGSYRSQHYSTLKDINRRNVTNLRLQWVFQAESLEKFESTPLVVDGVMYVVQMPNDVVALDAETGRRFWEYKHTLDGKVNVCCGRVNRGLAMLGNRLYMGTIDGRLIALDAKSGAVVWDHKIVDPTSGYSLALAPLAVKDKIIVGAAGGEYGIRGFLDAYNAETGERVWRFNTIPGPGEPGHETWAGDSWERGGGSIWLTGSYDPELNLMFWGVGNPSPDWNGDVRKGDNLYTDSAIAIDPDTGKLKWHFQFTPHDEWDWDAVQTPVQAEINFQGRSRKVLLWGNRNGFFYVLDRATGEFLLGKAFAQQNWASGLDEKGRPMKLAEAAPTREGTRVYPAVQGATNWYAPSYNPNTGLYYLSVWEFGTTYHKGDPTYTRGNRYVGSLPERAWPNILEDADPGYGALRALDPQTGDRVWEMRMTNVTESGLLSTAGDLLFSGNGEGHFFALDPANGALLWRVNLGGVARNSPITYKAGDRQYVSIASGHSLYTFALPQD